MEYRFPARGARPLRTTISLMREADTEVLAKVAFQARQESERRNSDLSVAKFKDALDTVADDDNLKVILCRSDRSEELLGWLSLHTGYTRMVFIGEWHPEVLPSDSYEEYGKGKARGTIQ
jgi:hypothetical protein